MPAPDAVTWDKLGKLNGTPRCPVLLDVLADRVRACDPRLFRGARPQAEAEALPAALGALAAALPARGRRRGRIPGRRGGGLDRGRPAAGRSAAPRDGLDGSVRVTRSRPKIDRIACRWMIRRFIDPRAVFLCVAPPEVTGGAELMGAMPHDTAGEVWSHRDPRLAGGPATRCLTGLSHQAPAPAAPERTFRTLGDATRVRARIALWNVAMRAIAALLAAIFAFGRPCLVRIRPGRPVQGRAGQQPCTLGGAALRIPVQA